MNQLKREYEEIEKTKDYTPELEAQKKELLEIIQQCEKFIEDLKESEMRDEIKTGITGKEHEKIMEKLIDVIERSYASKENYGE